VLVYLVPIISLHDATRKSDSLLMGDIITETSLYLVKQDEIIVSMVSYILLFIHRKLLQSHKMTYTVHTILEINEK